MFVDSGFSDLYCLYSEGTHDGTEKQNCLEFCYDLEFSYTLENVFFRSVNGDGQIVKDSKLSFLLKGRGELPVIFSNYLKFWTTSIIKNSSGEFLVGQKRVALQAELRKKLNIRSFYDFDLKLEGDSQNSFVMPVFDVLLVSKKVRNQQWSLEFKEK